MNHDELIARLEAYDALDKAGNVYPPEGLMESTAAALRDLIAMRNSDFEVYHEMFMALFNAAPDKYRSGVEMAQDIIAQREEEVIAAYIQGAKDVHENWQPDRDPDFTEAAHDYWAAIDAARGEPT